MQLTKSERDKKFWGLMLGWFKEQPTRKRQSAPLRRKYKPIGGAFTTELPPPKKARPAKEQPVIEELPPREDVWDWPDER